MVASCASDRRSRRTPIASRTALGRGSASAVYHRITVTEDTPSPRPAPPGAAASREAQELLRQARAEAAEIVQTARADGEKALEQAQTRAQELLRDSRRIANDVRTEGLEVVSDLREMGDSLRSNADRLLFDVQSVHSRLVLELDRAAAAAGREHAPDAPAEAPVGPSRVDTNTDALEVPDFIAPG